MKRKKIRYSEEIDFVEVKFHNIWFEFFKLIRLRLNFVSGRILRNTESVNL